MDFEIVQSFMMCWLRIWFWLDNILKMVIFCNPLVHSFFVIHYKKSCPFQPMYLQLLSKSTIFVTLGMIVLHGT